MACSRMCAQATACPTTRRAAQTAGFRHSCFSCHPLLMNPESIPDERIIDWFMMQFCIIQQAEYVLREHPRIPAQLRLGRCLIFLIQLDS